MGVVTNLEVGICIRGSGRVLAVEKSEFSEYF